jgi:hypothetical protein
VVSTDRHVIKPGRASLASRVFGLSFGGRPGRDDRRKSSRPSFIGGANTEGNHLARWSDAYCACPRRTLADGAQNFGFRRLEADVP